MIRYGLIAAAALATIAMPATAQRVERTTHTTVVRHGGPHHGTVVVKRRKVCTVRWVHHRKVRSCRWR